MRRNKEEQAIPPIPQPMISDEGASRYFPSLVVTTEVDCKQYKQLPPILWIAWLHQGE